MYNPQLKHWLGRISAPSLVLWGDSDGIVTSPLITAAPMRELIPGAGIRTPDPETCRPPSRSREHARALCRAGDGFPRRLMLRRGLGWPLHRRPKCCALCSYRVILLARSWKHRPWARTSSFAPTAPGAAPAQSRLKTRAPPPMCSSCSPTSPAGTTPDSLLLGQGAGARFACGPDGNGGADRQIPARRRRRRQLPGQAAWPGLPAAGLIARIVRGYTFVSRNYVPGDCIHLAGFSRGAYAVRALAGLIAAQGLLDAAKTDLADKGAAYRLGAAVWYAYRRAVLAAAAAASGAILAVAGRAGRAAAGVLHPAGRRRPA